MAGELEAVLRRLFDALDRKDEDALLSTFDEEVQAVDEVSRRWLSGRDAVRDFLRQVLPALESSRSELKDVRSDASATPDW